MKKKILLFFVVFFNYHFLCSQTKVFENKVFQHIENQEYYKCYRSDGILLEISINDNVSDANVLSGNEYYYGFSDTCIISSPRDLKSEGLFYFELDEIDFKVLEELKESDSIAANNYIERECTQLSIGKSQDGKIELYHIISSRQQWTIFKEIDMDSLSQVFRDFLKKYIEKKE